MLQCNKHGMVFFIDNKKVNVFGIYTEWKCTLCKKENLIKLEDAKNEANKIITPCRECKIEYQKSMLRQGLCQKCRKTFTKDYEKEQRMEKKLQQQEEINQYVIELRNCKNRGVCDILKLHHDKLQHDPERLQTKFIIELTCGTNAKNNYLQKRMTTIGDDIQWQQFDW